MPRKAQPWFRLYVEMIGDRKVRRLDMTQRWVWVAVLAAAGESPERGKLYVAEGLPMTVAELAEFAGVKEREAQQAIDRMRQLRMVTTLGDDGLIMVTNWDKRQYESDNSTARTRTHRERSKERSNAVPANVRRNAPETETEAETELTPVGGDRHLPSDASPEPIPTHCQDHRFVIDPGPCGGCKTAREHHERTQQRQAAAAGACTRCGGSGWIEDDAGNPVRKCNHRGTDYGSGE